MLVLLILVALVIVVAVVARPLRDPAPAADAPDDHEIEEAKRAKYRELREVELDWRTGKLSESDYERVRAQLRAEAAALLAGAEASGAVVVERNLGALIREAPAPVSPRELDGHLRAPVDGSSQPRER